MVQVFPAAFSSYFYMPNIVDGPLGERASGASEGSSILLMIQ